MINDKYKCKSPVVMIVFNRPDTAGAVFSMLERRNLPNSL